MRMFVQVFILTLVCCEVLGNTADDFSKDEISLIYDMTIALATVFDDANKNDYNTLNPGIVATLQENSISTIRTFTKQLSALSTTGGTPALKRIADAVGTILKRYSCKRNYQGWMSYAVACIANNLLQIFTSL